MEGALDWVATRHLANLGLGNALRVFGFLGGLQKNVADPLPTKISEKRDHALLDPITRSWPDHALFGFDHAFFFWMGDRPSNFLEQGSKTPKHGVPKFWPGVSRIQSRTQPNVVRDSCSILFDT